MVGSRGEVVLRRVGQNGGRLLRRNGRKRRPETPWGRAQYRTAASLKIFVNGGTLFPRGGARVGSPCMGGGMLGLGPGGSGKTPVDLLNFLFVQRTCPRGTLKNLFSEPYNYLTLNNVSPWHGTHPGLIVKPERNREIYPRYPP